jgi:hypothetical protein
MHVFVTVHGCFSLQFCAIKRLDEYDIFPRIKSLLLYLTAYGLYGMGGQV